MNAQIQVLLADDHPLIREGIGNTLHKSEGLDLIGVTTNGHEIRELVAALRPDVLLLDLSMPGPPALETVSALRKDHPQTRVLILSAFDDLVPVRSLLRAGVRGYVLKDEAIETLVQAIITVVSGGVWFSRSIANRLANASSRPDFTERELDVLNVLALGASNEDIADRLSVTERTVRYHLKNIYRKIDVSSRGEGIAWAVRAGYGKSQH
jgi:DNA-binding NarL/FixJ family response regulator